METPDNLAPESLAARVDDHVFAQWCAMPAADWAGLGRRLRALGLTPRAITQVVGVRSPVHAPWRARVSDVRVWPELSGVVPAALMVHLWVTGAHLELPAVRARLGHDFETLCALGLMACHGDRVAATVSMVPVGESLVVSDRADVKHGRGIAQVADDSALHTAGALRACVMDSAVDTAADPARWLDIGTGSAFVPLARPGVAAHIVGTDINPRAIAMARLGAWLSDVRHLQLEVADLLARAPQGAPWQLITFNAPIPEGQHQDEPGSDPRDAHDMPWYRFGERDILERFWAEVPMFIAPQGEVIVHSVVPEDGVPPWLCALPGHVQVTRYTPPGLVPAFAVSVWRPGRPSRRIVQQIVLSRDTPHITRAVLDMD